MCLTQGYPVTLGIIPIGKENTMARVLGVPSGEEACHTLSRRFIHTIPLARVNDKYFLTHCSMPLPKGSTLQCDTAWRLQNAAKGVL